MPRTPQAALRQRRNVARAGAWRRRCSCRCRAWASPRHAAGGLHAAGRRREVAGDDADLSGPPGHHGHHHPGLAADGARSAGAPAFSLGAAVRGSQPAIVGCIAMLSAAASRCCASQRCCRACRRHSSGISAWPPPTPREPAFRAKAISLVMAGGVACRLPRPADGQVGGRLAGARDVCRRLPG